MPREASAAGDAGAPRVDTSGAPPAGPTLRAMLEKALEEGSPGALEPLLRRAEQEAALSSEPQALWLLVARARRVRAEMLAGRAAQVPLEAPPGGSAPELLAQLSTEASSCAAAAHRCWSLQLPGAAAAIDAGQPPDAALASAPQLAAEPLYLDALCSAAWARAQGFTFFVEQRSLLGAELSRAAALAPDLDDDGPDRELGRLFASLPAYAGGDLAQARAHFERAISTAPGAPWNRVLYARSVAVKAQERALFNRLLGEALALPASSESDRAAQAEARSLLDRSDDLFGAAATPQDEPKALAPTR